MIEDSGIGHSALPIEIYLCEVDCGLHNPGQKFVDVWFTQDNFVHNRVLLNKWARLLRIWPRWLIIHISLLNRWIPGGDRHRVPYRYILDSSVPWQFCDIYNVLNSTRPHITFSPEEESLGLSALKKMGIQESDSIICFAARDNAYYSEDNLRLNHRNSSIHTMAEALNDLTRKGYKAIRMGAKVTERLQSTNLSLVDYATNEMRTELLDLFLISRCKFMVSTGVGLDSLAAMFRRPVVFVNWADFGHADMARNDSIFIPKKVWSITEKRFLTFSEIFRLRAHLFGLTWQYKREGIECVDNDVDEIRATILEMEQRLSGSWISDPEDEILQNQFRSIWPVRPAGYPVGHKVLGSRIGAQFLRQNRELLL